MTPYDTTLSTVMVCPADLNIDINWYIAHDLSPSATIYSEMIHVARGDTFVKLVQFE